MSRFGQRRSDIFSYHFPSLHTAEKPITINFKDKTAISKQMSENEINPASKEEIKVFG